MKSSVFRSSAIRVLVLAGLFILGAAAPGNLCAATFTWQGGGANNDWTSVANWVGGVAPPTNGNADLVFSGTAIYPNAPQAYSLDSITFNDPAFNSDAGTGFHLGGNALTLGSGGITQNSVSSQTIEDALVLGVNQT